MDITGSKDMRDHCGSSIVSLPIVDLRVQPTCRLPTIAPATIITSPSRISPISAPSVIRLLGVSFTGWKSTARQPIFAGSIMISCIVITMVAAAPFGLCFCLLVSLAYSTIALHASMTQQSKNGKEPQWKRSTQSRASSLAVVAREQGPPNPHDWEGISMEGMQTITEIARAHARRCNEASVGENTNTLRTT